jgi:hypothetical protein
MTTLDKLSKLTSLIENGIYYEYIRKPLILLDLEQSLKFRLQNSVASYIKLAAPELSRLI